MEAFLLWCKYLTKLSPNFMLWGTVGGQIFEFQESLRKFENE